MGNGRCSYPNPLGNRCRTLAKLEISNKINRFSLKPALKNYRRWNFPSTFLWFGERLYPSRNRPSYRHFEAGSRIIKRRLKGLNTLSIPRSKVGQVAL